MGDTIDFDDLDRLFRDYFRHWTLMVSADRKDRREAQAGDPLDDWLAWSLVSREGPAPDACWPVLLALIDQAPDDVAFGNRLQALTRTNV